MDNKHWRIRCRRLAAVVLVLLSVNIALDQAIAATSAEPSKNRFGWQYDYDERGRIASITDPSNKKTKIRYTQNKKGNLSGITQELPSGSKVKFKFDEHGRRTAMVDSAGVVRYAYDRFGRLTKVQRERVPAIVYGYDVRSRIQSVSIGTQFTLRYGYDFRGRPEKIATPIGNIRFTYNSKTGEVVRRLPNGISTRWVHSPGGRLDSITHTSSANRPLTQYEYTYRLDGLITSIKELTPSGVQTRRYRYDTAQRLVSASGGRQPKIEFAYDQLGNRTKLLRQDRKPISAQYDWMSRLTHYDGQLCQHDPAGNLTACAGSSKSFTFNDTGLLKTAALKNGNINYHYDGDGYLIRRSHGATKQTFVPDPLSDIWQPLAVKGSAGQQTFYIWDGASPLMAITGKQVRYFLHDHLGSVRLVTDRRGDIVERHDYTPFGRPKKKPAGVDLQPGFAGLFFDKAASVHLTRARAYDPELGRFLQRDPELRTPFGGQENLSQYPYCANDPVNYVDHTGGARRPVGVGVTHWASMLANMRQRQMTASTQGQQQEIRARQSRMTADIQRRQQEMRSQQSRMTANMQRQQQKMRSQQSRMAADILRRQQDIRWRQSTMAFDQQRMLARARRQTQDVAWNQGRAAYTFTKGTFNALSGAYLKSAATFTQYVSFGTGGLDLGVVGNLVHSVGTSYVDKTANALLGAQSQGVDRTMSEALRPLRWIERAQSAAGFIKNLDKSP